jgi:phosphoribosylaminoimidazole carboxylase PurE protein
VAEYAGAAEAAGIKVIIAAAGAAAHLAGAIASRTTLPVVGVPIPSSELKGLDSLLSTVQMPSGVPVATMPIGETGAANAAVLAAEILALTDSALAEKLRRFRKGLAEKIEGEQPRRSPTLESEAW